MVGVSRRRFLGLAGALAGALLAGCGRDEARRAPESDADVLSGLLAREQAVLAATAGASGAVVRMLREQDMRHSARLRRELMAAGGRAPATAPGAPSGELALKQQAVFAYVAALPRLSNPELRVLVMQIAASEAEHLAVLRLAAGEEPVPDAFAGFTAP